jgi:hypothetical protein
MLYEWTVSLGTPEFPATLILKTADSPASQRFPPSSLQKCTCGSDPQEPSFTRQSNPVAMVSTHSFLSEGHISFSLSPFKNIRIPVGSELVLEITLKI